MPSKVRTKAFPLRYSQWPNSHDLRPNSYEFGRSVPCGIYIYIEQLPPVMHASLRLLVC